MEAATGVLAMILASDGIIDANKKRVVTGLAAALATSLAHVMCDGSGLEARIDVARLTKLSLANAAGEANAKGNDRVWYASWARGTVDETGALDGNVADASLSCLAHLLIVPRHTRIDGAPWRVVVDEGDDGQRTHGWG